MTSCTIFWLQKADSTMVFTVFQGIRCNRHHTIQPRQDHVHDHDIGLGLLDQLPRRLAVAGVAHDLKLTGILQRVS